MNLKQMAAAVTLGAAAMVATGAEHPTHFDPYDLDNFNRHPQEIYEVTLTIHGAPGRLVPDDGMIDYVMAPETCLPENPQGKTSYDYLQVAPLSFGRLNRKVGNVYKTYVAMDLMKDRDYFGRGVCHWVVENFELHLRTGASTSGDPIVFTQGASDFNIKPSGVVATYFLKDQYFNPDNHSSASDGLSYGFTRSDYLGTPKSKRSKFFYTTMRFKKVKPSPSLQRWIWDQYSPLIP